IFDDAALTAGWHHVVAEFGDSTFTLFLDDLEVDSVATPYAVITAHSDDPGIGYQNNECTYGDVGTTVPFIGRLDEVIIHGSAPVTAGEMVLSSSDGSDILLSNPVVVGSPGTLTASDYSGAGGTPTVTLADLTVNAVLTLNATDGYGFAIPGAVSAPTGGLILAAGETEVGDSVNVAVLDIDGGTIDRGLVEHDIVVSRTLRLITDSLNLAGQTPVPITTDTEVVIGTGQALTMKGPFDGRALNLGGTLSLIGPQDLTVWQYLTMATDRDFTGAVLTTTGADVTVNSATVTVENALSADTMDLNTGTFNAGAALATDGDMDVDTDSELNVAGPLEVGDRLRVRSGSTLNADSTVGVGGNFLVRGGSTTADIAGALTVGGRLDVGAGVLNTGGEVTADELLVTGGALNTDAPVTVATSLDVTGGAFNAAGNVTAPTANATGGALNLVDGANLSVDTMAVGSGATVNTGPGRVVVSDLGGLKLGTTTYSTDLGSFNVEGADLVSGATITVTEPDSTLSIEPPGMPATAPVAHWAFDEASGTLAADSSGNGRDGTLTNYADPDSAWVPGKIGNALQFDGNDTAVDGDYVLVNGYTAISGTAPRTMAAWIKATRVESEIMSWGLNNAGEKWVFRVQDSNGTSGALRVEVNGGYVVGSTVLSDDEWHHVAAVFPEGGTNVTDVLLYVDGALEAYSATLDEPIDTADGNDVMLGTETWNTGRSAQGLMDEMFIYDVALEVNDLDALYQFGLAGSYADLPVNVPGTEFVVTANATIQPGTAADVTLGGVAVANDAVATLGAGPAGYSLGTAGGQGTIAGDFSLTGMFAPGNDGVGTLNVDNVVMEDGSGYEWGLGETGSDLVNCGELNVAGGWVLAPTDEGAAIGGYDPSTEYLLIDYTTLVGDAVAGVSFDLSQVEHWVWQGGLPTVVDDGSSVLVKGLAEVIEFQWALAGGGSYNVASNWLNDNLPDGVDAEAKFMEKITANSTVTVDTAVTVGLMKFRNPDYSYTIAGTESITLATSVGDPLILVEQGSHRIEAPLSLPGSLTVDTTAADASLTVNLDNTPVVTAELTKTGAGTLSLEGGLAVRGALSVGGGTMEVAEELLAFSGGVVSISAGGTLKTSGVVSRRVLGVPGAALEVTGTTDIGLLGETDGYAYVGALEVGSHMVGLKDADQAELYGAHMAGGTISTFNGLRLLPINMADGLNSRLYGYGTVNGNVVAGIEGNPVSAVVVADLGKNINFTGVVQTGNSTFVGDVSISGTERVGFSPAVGMKLGAPIGPDVVLDIYGDVGADFESEIPDSILPPPSDPVSGYGQFYVAGSESRVFGKMTLKAGAPEGMEPYVGQAGHTFDLIVTGQAW
ncbi:MAG: LamG-like jellyroll fold domain-containing protein, partial [Planctomycetota bacterium]